MKKLMLLGLLALPALAEKPEEKKTRLIFHTGIGLDGQNLTVTGNSVRLSDRRSLVLGLTVTRDIYQSVFISGTILSNQAYLGGIGFEL